MRRLSGLWTALVVGYLFAPIVVMAAFSFNDPAGRFNLVWRRFSLEAWRRPFDVPGLADALWLSVRIAVASTLLSAALGTLVAIALVRRRFRGRGALHLLVVLPLTTPDVVLGASLLSLLLTAGLAPGVPATVAAHVMLSMSYVALTVAARLRGLDPSLDEAAADLGAGEWRTLRTVTLPLLAPAIAAGSLLAFALSVDDFTMTLFVAGTEVTFPLWVWGAARVAVPPQINVLGTILILAAAAAMAGGAAVSRARK